MRTVHRVPALKIENRVVVRLKTSLIYIYIIRPVSLNDCHFNLVLTLTLSKNDTQIRFTRLGRKRQAFYRLVAIDSKKRRDGLPLEFLGWYDPIKKESSLNAPAIKVWLAKGALPSDTVGSLLKKALIMS